MMHQIRRPEMVFLGLCLAVMSLGGSARAGQQRVSRQLQDSRDQYKTTEAWAKRRTDLRREFLKGAKLWPLPKRGPMGSLIHSRRTYADYSVDNVALETLSGFYCTGNLYRPNGKRKPGPAILCPHGHFRPLGRMRANHQIRCAHFARMGATVFSYSMVGWQDSQQTTHDDPLVLALQTWNSICVVDFLTGLDGVDRQRVGVTGASGGGTQTFFLALVDDRVKVSAPLVIVYPWAAPAGCRCEGGMPVMRSARTNAIELAAATAPRPQMLISVGNDPTEKFPDFGFKFIKHVYQIHGRAEFVENLHFAKERHDFGPSKRNAVYKFFGQHLQMPLVAENMARISIERPDQMTVFSEQHPLPAHAIKGRQAVAEAFAKLRRPSDHTSSKD